MKNEHKTMKPILIITFLFLLFGGLSYGKNNNQSKSTIILSSHPATGPTFSWKMKRVSEINSGGEVVSSPGFNDQSWANAIVPGTALNSLVANGIFPEPYYGKNNMQFQKLIPDISEIGRDFYHFWYRTAFELPKDFRQKKIWMQFDGINYIAHIWLNGKKLGEIKGMFVQQKFDITSLANLNGKNYLAVSVEPVEFPGNPQGNSKDILLPNENHNGGDGVLGKNVTMLMSAGWDFTFQDGIRDRNTGIWRDIKVFASGGVTIENPFVKSILPIPELSPASEEITAELKNTLEKAVEVNFQVEIKEAGIKINKKIKIDAGTTAKVLLTPDEFIQLKIDHPRLWWPINKGPQNLYTLVLKAKIDGKTSHEITKRFGIRDIRSDRNNPEQARQFYVNGKRLFIRGSNWIPEAMLRTSKERTEAELRYTKQAGINMLRLWGGGISESDDFFDLCDEMGILVWHEFWMTGNTKPPVDTALYFNNVRSTIKRIRNHPSLAYYVSSNEQDDVLDILPILTKLDGTRGYQFQSECCGVHDGSPYKYENPMQYYDNTASSRGSRIDGFCPEYGAPSLPVIESLREMMPKEDLWPMNKETWDYMDGNGFHYMTTKYKTAVEQYGMSTSIDDYAKKGQLVGAVAYRSIWENWNYNKFEYGDRYATGVLFWYHNSPVRQVCARFWDWSLEPTAALYYSQDALEPVHAQFDFIKNTVSVYNDLYRSLDNVQVKIRVINMNMETVFQQEKKISLPEDAVANDILSINLAALKLSPVHFIKLEIFDSNQKLISDSFYWRSTNKYNGPWTTGGPLHGGFESLDQLPETNLEYRVITKKLNEKKIYEVELKNNTGMLAFFNRLKLIDTNTQTLARPAFYTDNYFSLLPGESKKVSIEIALKNLSDNTRLVLSGYNVAEKIID